MIIIPQPGPAYLGVLAWTMAFAGEPGVAPEAAISFTGNQEAYYIEDGLRPIDSTPVYVREGDRLIQSGARYIKEL